MDPFEEFEFKPLTEGLGFQKKKQEKANVVTAPLQQEMASEKSEDKISFATPLPRVQARQETPSPKIKPHIPASTPAVEGLLKTLSDKPSLDFLNKPAALTKKPLQKEITPAPAEDNLIVSVSPSLAAGFLDTMLVIALQLMCLIAMMLTTQADLMQNLMNPDAQNMIYISFATLIFGTTWIYYTLTRMFIGSTLGEWVYDQQMGQNSELFTTSYFAKISLRPLITAATGIVILPLVSKFLGYDLVGRWIGLELIQKDAHG